MSIPPPVRRRDYALEVQIALLAHAMKHPSLAIFEITSKGGSWGIHMRKFSPWVVFVISLQQGVVNTIVIFGNIYNIDYGQWVDRPR